MNAFLRAATLLTALLVARCDCGDALDPIPPRGNVEGYICHPVLDALAVGVSVTGVGTRESVTTVTDQAGYFILMGLAAGPQSLAIQGSDFADTLDITVVAGKTIRAPDPACLVAGTGTVTGRICATDAGIGSGTGHWLAGARVYIVIGSDVYETITDADGNFVLQAVPVGTHTLWAEQGSFSASTLVTVTDGSATPVDHVCVAPGTKIGVVTGQFDSVEQVLTGMGFGIAACMPAGAAFCPATLAASGTVTLIEGESTYFITDVLDDNFALQQFDIIFFNCGLADSFLLSAPDTAKANLNAFVHNGGSIYASDWAYEIIRVIFPGELDFYGNDIDLAYRSPDGRVGLLASALPASIADATLATVLGSSTVDLNYNKGSWVPLVLGQPPNVYTWISGTVLVDPGGTQETWSDAPLLVSKPVGSGRILYTTFHTHQQVTGEMTAILRHIIFEL